MDFQLSKKALEARIKDLHLLDDSCGAIVSFEGRVRRQHQNKEVLKLEYSVYEDLAISEGTRILRDAQEKYRLHQVRAIHRHGLLMVGELAIWISVASPHRAEAFAACQYIIDNIKRDLPVWKREWYLDGSVQWVFCQDHKHS